MHNQDIDVYFYICFSMINVKTCKLKYGYCLFSKSEIKKNMSNNPIAPTGFALAREPLVS